MKSNNNKDEGEKKKLYLLQLLLSYCSHNQTDCSTTAPTFPLLFATHQTASEISITQKGKKKEESFIFFSLSSKNTTVITKDKKEKRKQAQIK